MANTIRIARSTSTNTPPSLDQGELAYSEDGSPNSEGELFIGTAGAAVTKVTTTVLTGTDGVAAQPNSSAQDNDPAQDNQTITSGTGLDGADGGSSGDITLTVALDELPVTVPVTGDWLAFDDAGTSSKALISSIPLSIFSNDSNWTSNTGTVTAVTGGTGALSSGGTTPAISLDYVGTDNFMDSATNLEGTAIDVLDTVIYHDATDDTVKKGLVSDLPFGIGSGDISRVNITAGDGLTGTQDTLTGDHTQTINAVGGTGITASADSLDLDFSELTDMTGDIAGTTELILQDGVTESRKAASEIQLSFFNNDSGWEANDAATVLTTDTGSSSWNWILDEDAMGSDSAAHVPTQQSVKAYVDNAVTGGLTHKGGYNAATDTPALDTGSPVLAIGDMYTVTVAGTFFTEALEVGDVLISDVDSVDAASIADWTIVQNNLGAASETEAGYIQLATQTEMNTATNDTKAVTPLKYANSTIDGGTF